MTRFEALIITIRKNWLLTCLFLIIGTVFLLRGPLRALTGSDLNDLVSPYVQSTAWRHGADPYSSQSPFGVLARRCDAILAGAQ